MPTTLSVDLHQRMACAVAAGATCREAAERFKVSRASASRWSQQKQRVKHVAPKSLGGDQRSRHIAAHAEFIRQTYEARPQNFLRELRDALQEPGCCTSRRTRLSSIRSSVHSRS
ncbi:transposase [Methylobacterium sp. BE186]|nr:transposase [Methylobacterium sp. BE186]